MPKDAELILVCPNSKKLLASLKGKTLVVRVSSVEEIQGAYDNASAESHIYCMAVDEHRALSAVRLQEQWKAVPISLHVPEMGSLKKVLGMIGHLREWNIRVFMPGSRVENMLSLRILSSLSVNTGLTLVPGLDWVAANDLMHYAVYTRTMHGDIDPFSFVKKFYNPQDFTYLTSPFFENPVKYVHIDEEEHVALSADGLRDGKWICTGLECLPGLRESAEYKRGLNGWQSFFLDDHKCSYCPAWRLCLGAFVADCGKDENVYRLFEDLVTAADESYANRKAGTKWQP